MTQKMNSTSISALYRRHKDRMWKASGNSVKKNINEKLKFEDKMISNHVNLKFEFA